MTKEERQEKLRRRQAELKESENELRKKGYRYIAGVDEAGRGPLAGPVVAAAVVLPEDFDVPGIDDSKKLSEKKREELFEKITEGALAWGTGTVDRETIDEINILQATKAAMRAALEEADSRLREAEGEKISIDYILFDAMKIDETDIPQESVIKGDSKVLAIAAASIVAKVTRDRIMKKLALDYPQYSFEKNKGYGTKAHYEAIEKYGICSAHRRSFLKKVLKNSV